VRPADEKKKTPARGVGGTERTLYTCERPGWVAKNRYNLPPELPFEVQSLFEAMYPA